MPLCRLKLPTICHPIPFRKKDILLKNGTSNWFTDFCSNPVAMIVIVIATSLLLVSEFPMFSLKFKHFGWAGNEKKFILIVFAVVAMIIFGMCGILFAAAFTTILFYMVMCIVDFFIKKRQ